DDAGGAVVVVLPVVVVGIGEDPVPVHRDVLRPGHEDVRADAVVDLVSLDGRSVDVQHVYALAVDVVHGVGGDLVAPLAPAGPGGDPPVPVVRGEPGVPHHSVVDLVAHHLHLVSIGDYPVPGRVVDGVEVDPHGR